MARAAAVYYSQRIAQSLEYYVLALVRSGTKQDIALAWQLLVEADESHGEHWDQTIFTEPDCTIGAAEWIARFDLVRLKKRPGMTLAPRLQALAHFGRAMKCSNLKKRSIAVNKALEDARLAHMEQADIFALRGLCELESADSVSAFVSVQTALSCDAMNPYARMVAHRLYSRGATVLMNLLMYCPNDQVKAFGIADVQGAGLVCKPFIGKGYLRSESGQQIEDNYSPILLMTHDEMKAAISSGEVLAAPILGKEHKLPDFEWSIWMDAKLFPNTEIKLEAA